jgi:tripartite-type tricarboxylate transporter receptor subunit TctC
MWPWTRIITRARFHQSILEEPDVKRRTPQRHAQQAEPGHGTVAENTEGGRDMKRTAKAISYAFSAVLIAAPLTVLPQAYPSKPIRVVQPFPPGAPADTQLRALGPLLAQSMGQPIIVDNRPGADGLIGMEGCLAAAPDGYTLCDTSSEPMVTWPLVHSKLPYNAERDFVPIINHGVFASAILAGASFPANNMQEMLAIAKKAPGSVTFGVGSSVPTTAGNLYIEWFKATRDVHFLAVPYKSTTQALNAVVAGEVQVTLYAMGQAARFAKAGKVKVLAAVGDKRSAYLPEVPSLKEQGIDVTIAGWFGLFGRTGTPEAIIRRLSTEIRKAFDDPVFKEKYASALGLVYESNSPDEFAEFIRNDRANYAKLFKLIGFKPD